MAHLQQESCLLHHLHKPEYILHLQPGILPLFLILLSCFHLEWQKNPFELKDKTNVREQILGFGNKKQGHNNGKFDVITFIEICGQNLLEDHWRVDLWQQRVPHSCCRLEGLFSFQLGSLPYWSLQTDFSQYFPLFSPSGFLVILMLVLMKGCFPWDFFWMIGLAANRPPEHMPLFCSFSGKN